MKLKSLLAIVAPVAVLFTSCLKSHNSSDLLNDKGSIVTEISDVSYYGDVKFLSLDLLPATETVTLISLKSYAPRSTKPNGPIHVKLAIDNSGVAAAGLNVLPTNAYTITSLEADVPAGGSVDIPITLNKNNMNL